jgi:hypothetical protein
MSTKKTTAGTRSTAKRKASANVSGSGNSKTRTLPTATKRPTKGAHSLTLSLPELGARIKKAKSLHALALCMYYIRDAGTTVKVFDFPADARFYQELQAGNFKKALKIAQERYNAVAKARGRVVAFEDQLAVRKAYNAALHKWLLTKAKGKKEREFVTARLAHFINQRPTVKTPFGSDTHAENPFDSDDAPLTDKPKRATVGKSKRRV